MEPAHKIAARFKKGEISAQEILEKTFAQIDKHEESVQAFLALFKERAHKKAEILDKKRKEGKNLGKLAGVPIALKDNMFVKGELATCGSKFLAHYRAPFDATITELLEQEDALIIGKTNMDEFAMGSSTENSAFKHTKNPWNLSCSPGGSSGGSAAAVSARFCPLALGSDTGGSIRQPAAFCGVVGFKPTYGRVSRWGLVAFASSLDQIGPFSTCTEDTALIMETLGKHCEKDSTSIPHPQENYTQTLHNGIAKKRIGVPWNFLKDLSPDVKESFQKSIEVYKSLGCSIVEVDLDILKYSIAVYYILATAEASSNLARFDGIRYGTRSSRAKTLEEVYDFSRQEGFGMEVKNRILLGTFVLSSGYQDAYYKKAQKVRTLMIEKFRAAFSSCDIIAMPSSPFAAFSLGSVQDPMQMYLQDIYTICANLAGLPAISIPAGFIEGKPLGLQLLAPALQDGLVLTFAHAYEKQTNHVRVPPAYE